MKFRDLIRRADNTEKSFEELEADLADAVDECIGLGELSAFANDDVPGETPVEEDNSEQTEDDASTPEPALRLTSHTQSRMAALSSFDGLFRDAKLHFEEINASLSEIAGTHHLTREFFHILHGDILRANELELANLNLTAEQRVLSDKLNDLNRRQHERESIVEALQQREASLVQDSEALRAALARQGWNSWRPRTRTRKTKRNLETSQTRLPLQPSRQTDARAKTNCCGKRMSACRSTWKRR
ncbi:hypothetical protein ACVDG5_000650 [Mesorhizobium sp. ORM6]